MNNQERSLDPVHALAAAKDAAGEHVWYAARATGLYRSTDAGSTWSDAYSALDLDNQLTTASVVVSPGFSTDRTIFAGALGGILRSVDSGESWTVSELPKPPPFVVSLACSPNYAEDGLVFAGTLEDGVFRSWDRGSAWASWNFGLLDLNVFCLAASTAFADDDTLFVGTESGVFRSTNGGRAWRETAFPMDASPVLSLAISSTFETDHMLHAGTESSGVWRSNDGGGTWSALALQDSGEAVNHLLLLKNACNAQDIIAITSTAVYMLQIDRLQGGALWRVAEGAEISAATLLDMNKEPTVLLGMNDGSVQRVPISKESN